MRWWIVAGLAAIFVVGTGSRAPRGSVVRCDRGEDLQTAIDTAPAGKTIVVRGTCVGTFVIAGGVHLRGGRDATLHGDGTGTVVSVLGESEVTLSDLTVTGGLTYRGLPADVQVAGVYNEGSLTLDGRTSVEANGGFVNCDADCSMYKPLTGGVINKGTLVLRDRASVRNNHGGTGVGGVRNYGTLVLRDRSTIEENSVYNNLAGGVWNGGTLQVHDRASVRGNTASGPSGTGAGVRNDGAMLLDGRARIEENEASQPGGGVYNSGTLALGGRASIRENRAYTGAGIFTDGGSIVLDGHYTITGNVARHSGGGIYLSSGGAATIVGSLARVTGNTPDQCVVGPGHRPC